MLAFFHARSYASQTRKEPFSNREEGHPKPGKDAPPQGVAMDGFALSVYDDGFPNDRCRRGKPIPIQIAVSSGDIAAGDFFCNTVQEILARTGLKQDDVALFESESLCGNAGEQIF